MSNAIANLTCPVQGNADLYGLGIRIGIYIQMLTVQLSGVLSATYPLEDHIGQGTIIIVMSTAIVLVRMLNATIGQHANLDNPLQPVEVFPMLTLLLLQMGVCRATFRNKPIMLIWLAELLGLTVLFVWFWWHGMDLLPRSCPDDKAFFFAKVSIWNWFRTFNKVTSVFLAVGTGISFPILCALILMDFTKRFHNFWRGRKTKDDDTRDEVSPQKTTLDIFVNISAIVYVEVSLRWNDIQGVHSLNSPGQFMPFVVALGQLFGVFFMSAKAMMLSAADEHAFDREDESQLHCRHECQGHGTGGDTENIALSGR